MQQRIEVAAPIAEYYEMELDGVPYKLRPTLGFLRSQEELRSRLPNMPNIPYAEIEEIVRPAMLHYHTDEEIDRFLNTATIVQVVRLMSGNIPDEAMPQDFMTPPETGEKPQENSG